MACQHWLTLIARHHHYDPDQPQGAAALCALRDWRPDLFHQLQCHVYCGRTDLDVTCGDYETKFSTLFAWVASRSLEIL